jgi:hypothetical protein
MGTGAEQGSRGRSCVGPRHELWAVSQCGRREWEVGGEYVVA